MREIRLSGLEGGVALTRHPYPYNPGIPWPFDAIPLALCFNEVHRYRQRTFHQNQKEKHLFPRGISL